MNAAGQSNQQAKRNDNMKKTILAVTGLSLLVGILCFLTQTRTLTDAPAPPVAEAVTAPPSEVPLKAEPILAAQPLATPPAPPPSAKPAGPAIEPSPASSKARLDEALVSQAVEVLVSAQAGHGQKQQAWKQLREQGRLDLAIKTLEQRLAAEPQAAAYPAALGQAYFEKCATLQDLREQAILAMQADKVLDLALNNDPANWEARFTKAVAMSHWPASMNKGPEVVEHFRTLIEQQEAQAPQPHFADSYVLLGEQYQKAGHADYARMVWERGAAMFPTDRGLKQKLAVGLATGGQ
jgi:tetratricopeptide (TPR) repeat protein